MIRPLFQCQQAYWLRLSHVKFPRLVRCFLILFDHTSISVSVLEIPAVEGANERLPFVTKRLEGLSLLRQLQTMAWYVCASQ